MVGGEDVGMMVLIIAETGEFLLRLWVMLRNRVFYRDI
jgi:hypothetical protein